MSGSEQLEEEKVAKGGVKSILIAVFLSIICGGGVGYAVYSKIVPIDSILNSGHASVVKLAGDHDDRTYVELPEIIVALGEQSEARYLRASIYLETASANVRPIENEMPRIVDVVSSYLRAADVSDLQEPAATIRLRSLLLHRVRLIVGREAVSDLLVTEFIFN